MINIHIEPTSRCNAKCYYCINGVGSGNSARKQGFLPLDFHHRIFRDLAYFMDDFSCAPTLDKKIYLRYCGVGEPLLHPDILLMLEEGLGFPSVSQVAVLSNGTGWSREITDKFIEISVLHPGKIIELIFSLDTLEANTQFKIKQLNSIRKITAQLLSLIEQKAKKGSRNMHLIFQIIVLDENIAEVKEFCDFWAKAVSGYGLTLKTVYSADYPRYFTEYDCFVWIKCRDSSIETQKKYSELHGQALRYSGISTSGPGASDIPKKSYLDVIFDDNQPRYQTCANICSMLWYGVTISAHGDISPCCSDVNFELKIGNLNKESLIQIYQGNAMKKLRLAHIKGDLREYPLCMNCNIRYRGTPVHKEDVMRYIDVLGGGDNA